MTDIPITANERKAQFTGNTGLGPFAFTFNILANSDIRVIKNSTVLTLTSEYTVTTNVDGTGSVTLTGSGNGTALISSDVLTIIGNRQLARTSDYVQGGNLFAEALNEDLDSIVIMMQQLDEKVSRTMRIDAGDIGENLLLPSKASRLNRVLQFNASTGDPEAGPTAADVANAQTNATNAASSATAAASSASAAATSATAAAGSATAAAGSATAAAASASAAQTAETNAETAEANTLAIYGSTQDVADAVSAAQAAQSAAESAETNAAASETAAASSASAAATSETNAANSASSASTSASNASTSATSASNSASAASTSATNASNSATAAASSASAASTSEANTASSASAASTSASNAATSETNAANSASNAATSETNAATSASNASTSATNAAASASNASTSASNAASSATAASNAQSAAETARDQTLAAYDNFDDRYLGAKTSDPTLDNDGNALVGGALYFNTTDGVMKVYTGSVWVAAYASLTGALLVANNLSDLQNISAARDNLDLGTSDTPAFSGVTINGNITVTGTVDGRDVSTDGSKLDGIEAGADVTDTANVTAAGALMDSELSNITAVKAINQGLATTDSPTFAGATVNGNITVTGTVDGRDIATDGTKLDGIEAGANVGITTGKAIAMAIVFGG